MDSEDIGKARAAVVAKSAENQVLAFLIEDKDPGEHDSYVERATVVGLRSEPLAAV